MENTIEYLHLEHERRLKYNITADNGQYNKLKYKKMKTLNLLLVTALWTTLCTGLSSCNNEKTRSDIEFRPNGYYYEKGSNTLFTGSITEMEGKCKTIKSYLNGERHKVETYYPNGQVGYYFEYAAGGVIEKSHCFYDPDGNACTSGEFQGWINYYKK